MIKKMRVLFLIPQRRYISGDVPLGICSLTAFLKQQIPDIEVVVLDGNVLGTDVNRFRSLLNGQKFDLAGVFFDTLSFSRARDLVCMGKEFANVVVAGGPHATALPKSLFSIEELDVIIPGEGEYKLKRVIDALETRPLPTMPGIYVRQEEGFVFEPDNGEVVDLDKLPIPDRGDINMPFYIERFNYLDVLRYPVKGTTMIVSRGCPFKCTYCQPLLNKHFGNWLRLRSPKLVIEEIKYLKERYAVEGIFFHDDTMTVSKKWLLKLCDLMDEAKLDIVWGCNSRVDTFKPDIVKRMAASGLRKVHLGIESGSQRILDKIYKKGTNLEEIHDAIGLGKRLGVHMLGFFMLGAPTETKKEIKNTIRLAVNSKLTEASFSIFTPLPSSELWFRLSDRLSLQEISFDDLNYYSDASINLGVVPPNQIKKLQMLALTLFYAHPYRWRYLISHFKSVRQLKKFFVKFNRVFGVEQRK